MSRDGPYPYDALVGPLATPPEPETRVHCAVCGRTIVLKDRAIAAAVNKAAASGNELRFYCFACFVAEHVQAASVTDYNEAVCPRKK